MKYPFNVYYMKTEDDQFWIAECKSLKGCVGQGDTPERAIKELEINEDIWLQTAEEYGIPIPEIPLEPANECSGKFTVRVAPHVHKKAVELAKKQGISLNQYVNDAIVFQNSALITNDYIVPKVKDSVKTINVAMVAAFSASTYQVYNATNQYNVNTEYVCESTVN